MVRENEFGICEMMVKVWMCVCDSGLAWVCFVCVRVGLCMLACVSLFCLGY